MVRRFALLVACISIAAALPGCGILQPGLRELGVGVDDAKWIEWKYRNLSSASALQLAQSAVQTKYPHTVVDVYRGTLESNWVYGRYADVTHQALRARVRVEAEPEEDHVVVRLRVQQETSPTAGRYVSHDPGDWEPYEDDPVEAHRLMTKLNVLLSQVGERIPEQVEQAEAAK